MGCILECRFAISGCLVWKINKTPTIADDPRGDPFWSLRLGQHGDTHSRWDSASPRWNTSWNWYVVKKVIGMDDGITLETLKGSHISRSIKRSSFKPSEPAKRQVWILNHSIAKYKLLCMCCSLQYDTPNYEVIRSSTTSIGRLALFLVVSTHSNNIRLT
jgi:hypothetical protein